MSQVEIGTKVLYSYDHGEEVYTREAEVTAIGTNGNVDLRVSLDDSGNKMDVQNIAYNAEPKALSGTYQLMSVGEVGSHGPTLPKPPAAPTNPVTGAPSNPDVSDAPAVPGQPQDV